MKVCGLFAFRRSLGPSGRLRSRAAACAAIPAQLDRESLAGVHAKHRLNLLLALLLLGCGRVRYGDAVIDAPTMDAFSAMDVFSPPDAFEGPDAAGLPDTFVPPDAFMPDAFVPPDAFIPDAFVPPDAFMPDAFVPPDAFMPDAFVPPDARPSCSDLRLYYRFENASGMLVDESGCGNHGVPTNVLFGEPSPRGVSYRFARAGVSNATVLVPDSASLSRLTQMTLEAWVRQQSGGFSIVVSHGDGVDDDPYSFGTFTAREPVLNIGNSPTCTGFSTALAPSGIPLDTWTHIAATLDTVGRELVFFIDGVEVSREPSSAALGPLCDSADPMSIGAMRPDGTLGLQGWIDEVRIWSVVRTQAEVCMDAGGVPGAGGTCVL